jgi:hypothetical protein
MVCGSISSSTLILNFTPAGNEREERKLFLVLLLSFHYRFSSHVFTSSHFVTIEARIRETFLW